MSTPVVVRLSPEPASRFVYDFLAHPPSPRTRPVEPLPPTPTVRATVRPAPRRRASTISAISSWTTPGSHAFAPVNSPAASRRPSLVRTPRSARRHSATFHSFFSTPHTADLHSSGYTSAITQLPITPRTAAAPRLPPSYFPSNNCHTDMKFTLAAAPRQREGSISVPFPSTPAKRKGVLMRFLRPGARPRSTTTTKPPPAYRQVQRPVPPPPSSPTPTTTDALRIAHQKRVHYARHGALPLPLEAEVELMLFADGGSRSDAVARLGVPTYTDAAGVVYADETEAAECLPLLLAPEDNNPGPDENHSDVFAFASSSPLPSPIAHRTPPLLASAPLATPSAQAVIVASSPRSLMSFPSSPGGDAGAAAYLHLTFDPSSVAPARGRARRRRPTPLTVPTCLRPTVVIGFDDSFVPSCGGAVSEASVKASVVRDAEMEFRGLRAMRRE